jgi:methyltransferase family protein
MIQLGSQLTYRHLLLTTRPRRYTNLFKTIYQRRCRNLVEIGTWNGIHAEQMIKVAAARSGIASVKYTGFDLFEDLTEEQLRQEFSKRPPTYREVLSRLERTGATVTLYRGNTRHTLATARRELAEADLVFIDGGHSVETISADWQAVRETMGPRTTVIFDDFYPDPLPQLQELGCQTIIENLDRTQYSVQVLQPIDSFEKPWGTLRVQMVRVTKPVTRRNVPTSAG